MNREIWRSVKKMNWMEAEKELRAIYDPEIKNARVYAYKDAFSATFTALHDRFPELMTGQMMHSIAVDAVEYTRGVDSPEELIERLYQATGFDIRQRAEDQPFEYIEKGGVDNAQFV